MGEGKGRRRDTERGLRRGEREAAMRRGGNNQLRGEKRIEEESQRERENVSRVSQRGRDTQDKVGTMITRCI